MKIIGNIIKDQWFDYGSFFDDMKNNTADDNGTEVIWRKNSLSEMFKDGYEYAEVSGGSRLSGQNKFLLHRCDPEKLCICDFIGWKEIEAKND